MTQTLQLEGRGGGRRLGGGERRTAGDCSVGDRAGGGGEGGDCGGGEVTKGGGDEMTEVGGEVDRVPGGGGEVRSDGAGKSETESGHGTDFDPWTHELVGIGVTRPGLQHS